MNKHLRDTFIACSALMLTGCYTQRQSRDDNAHAMDKQIRNMKTNSHYKFLSEIKAEPDFESNAKAFKLDKKDTTKNTYMDKFGAYASMRDAKLLYDLDHMLTFQLYTYNFPVDKKTYGFSKAAPVLFIDQYGDGKPESIFDKRFHQIDNDNALEFKPALNKQAQKPGHFTLDRDENVVEHLTLGKSLNIHYELTYDFKKKMIFGQCPGTLFKQTISSFEDANPVLKEVYGYAQDWKSKQKTRTACNCN